MKDEQDALGHEIYDYLQGKEVVEIIERDDGFIGTSGGPAASLIPMVRSTRP
ncbi:MAG: hypothetical protein L0332_31595 [Chloroflexi bacterium]|nr:hypothetical protein [Chloroflexota bacterium]MCI0579769.1 hypothetical protein [Chloroflexota bacterium]MCI0649141.1 hypothetical protein [Chloroflexota bacterium]MCI0731247.1 hypothetical protein [Chloroflexota bacterium]